MPAVLSLEFTDLECKVAVVESGRGGRTSVKSLSAFDLTRPDELAARVAERAQALREHLKSQRIMARQAVLVIPKNYVMVRTVTLPSTVEDEIAGMARFEAERHIPFNADRHIVSYHVLSRNGAQGSEVLLAAVDLPIAQEYLDICVKAGLQVTGITVSSVALFNAFAATQRPAMVDRTVMVVNAGRSGLDLVIATNGHVTFARGSTTGVVKLLHELEEATGESVSLEKLPRMDALEPQLYFRPKQALAPSGAAGAGGSFYDELSSDNNPESGGGEQGGTADASTDDPSAGFTIIPSSEPPPAAAAGPDNPGAAAFSHWMNRLLQEVKRTFEFASREFSTPMVDHIYLSGEGALIGRVADYFQANFNVNTSIFDPLQSSGAVTGPKKSDELSGRVFAEAIGGAMSGLSHTVKIDLLPASYTEARSAKRQQISYMVTGALVMVMLVAGYVYLSDVFARKRDLMEELVKQNRADSSRVKDLRMKKERLRIIKENVQDDRGALDVLRILSEKPYIPEKVALTAFDYKRGDYVKLEGDAKDLQSANQLINDMRGTGFFVDARLDDTTPNKQLRGRGGATVMGWKATFTFPKPVKQKPKSKAPTKENSDGLE